MTRPIDCPKSSMDIFFDMHRQNGEVTLANLRRGVPGVELLFFCGTEDTVMGVGAIRFANKAYHRHLFERAGVPGMFNPWSVEACWLYVRPEHRRKGVWRNIQQTRMNYLRDRPCHTVRRVENRFAAGNNEYEEAGEPFYSDTSTDKLRLLVYNHDPVLDKSKRLVYA